MCTELAMQLSVRCRLGRALTAERATSVPILLDFFRRSTEVLPQLLRECKLVATERWLHFVSGKSLVSTG